MTYKFSLIIWDSLNWMSLGWMEVSGPLQDKKSLYIQNPVLGKNNQMTMKLNHNHF